MPVICRPEQHREVRHFNTTGKSPNWCRGIFAGSLHFFLLPLREKGRRVTPTHISHPVMLFCAHDFSRQDRSRTGRTATGSSRSPTSPRARVERDVAARRADGADAARADRDDDDRSWLHRTSRQRSGRRRRAGGHGVFHQLHHRHGTGIGGGAAGRAGVRRPRSTPGTARAASWPLGGAADRAADHAIFVLRRRHPARAGPGAGSRPSRAAISVRPGLGRRAGAVVHGDRGFMGAVNRPQPALWITLAAIPANALLAYLLIYGEWGFPRLELFGAGLATSLVNFVTLLAGLWFAIRVRPFRKYHVLGKVWRFDWPLMRQLVAIGAPISLSFMLEYGLFSTAALLMGLISTIALAAHQVALQVTAVLFMVPYGISQAATVRVGHAVGRADAPGVKRAGLVALLLGIALGL